ncbi:putative ribosome biogenesis protein urb1 [Rosellinia necatrix]|uniref:Putative ribosome biogenesis protein urb1 n=1 Tax=Rosellinia necatrix TaxID=77044 RepID=A0A1W2TEA5_ROSNE|nr:putative ribosome biogenesis protein urb1 [Rosellinia necatrix]
MAKRKSYGGDGLHTGKKQKTNHVHETPTSEEVHTGRQLRHLLTFEQDLHKARHGLQSFKNVLDSIVSNDEKKAEHMQIVLEFLDSSKPRDVEDEVPIYLPDIMETWSMASQMDNENVMSAVPVVLALLLKTISANVDLTPYALGIGRTLLQKRQQELIAKNLSADKGKDFIISPTLRLLRETICLDGGALAAPIFRARSNTFKSLARNMGLRYIGDGKEDPKRPSVRTNATRLLLSCLALLHNEAKRDLLLQKDIVAALMRHLRDDPPLLIYEILNVLKTSVIKDKKLAKEAKIKILNAHSLTRIASLYGYSKEPASMDDGTENKHASVEDAAHEILLATCTDSALGICRSEQGYYPEGIAPDAFTPNMESANHLDFGLDSIPWMKKFGNEIPVRNMLLAEFIESLRPWSSTKQSELLVAIFEASPELIARYFIHKKTFTFEPKLSATWIGYAAFLYNVLQLPVPPFFGRLNDYAAIPPPTSVVLDNIAPLPMTSKAMTKCLTNKSKLISFYAMRLLVLSLEKLGRALEMHREASKSLSSIWQEAARRLVDDFYQRLPDIKDVINCYRTLADGDLLQRETASRLILLYYEIIPQLALRAKFDVSPTLLATIQKSESCNGTSDETVISLLELEHLCAVAKYSPSMRWFARAPEMPTSPFTTLLRLYTEKTTMLSSDTLSQILSYVANEYQLVENRSQGSGLNPLMAALKHASGIDSAIWSFIDNCAERCSRTPTKYLEMIEETMGKIDADDRGDIEVSPLLMSMAEQLPFLMSTSPKREIMKQLAGFLRDYLRHSLDAGVSRSFLASISNLLATAFGDQKLGGKVSLPKRKCISGEDTKMSGADPESIPHLEETKGEFVIRLSPQELEDKLMVPILTSKENSLLRWSTKPPEELVEEGHAASLILLLSSDHVSLRKEALTNIIKMAAKIKESAYEENEQIWLLLMELAESAKDLILSGPLPSILVIFACKALDILKNPLHCLYEKVNLFLTSGPIWQPDKIPLMKAILQDGPTMDGVYYTEISWFIGLLVDSLRTPQDVALFHQHKVYERLFALPINPYMGPNLRAQVLRVLYRTACIPGGSDTVITRFGAISWLVAQKAASVDDTEKMLYQAVARRLWETCDQKRITTWSKGSIGKLI